MSSSCAKLPEEGPPIRSSENKQESLARGKGGHVGCKMSGLGQFTRTDEHFDGSATSDPWGRTVPNAYRNERLRPHTSTGRDTLDWLQTLLKSGAPCGPRGSVTPHIRSLRSSRCTRT